ncbi:MAG: hypothetical protein JJT96_11305 [Opitutales bacterium]|nr:hypothetical protein [Opitutales bacterium]
MPKTLGSHCLNGFLVDPLGELATAFGLYFHHRKIEILEATTPDPAELWLPADCDFALVADIGPNAVRHVLRALLDQDPGLPIVVAGLRTVDDAVIAVNNGASRIYGAKIDFADLEVYFDSLPSKRLNRKEARSSADDLEEGPVKVVSTERLNRLQPLDPKDRSFSDARKRSTEGEANPSETEKVSPTASGFLEPHVLPEIQWMSLANQERVLTSAIHALDEAYSTVDCVLVSSRGMDVFRQVAHAYGAWCGIGSGGVRFCESPDSCLEEIGKVSGTGESGGQLLAIGGWDTFPQWAREAIATAYLRHLADEPHEFSFRLLLGHCSSPDDWSVLRFTHQQLFRGTCLIALPELPPLGA